VHILSDDIYEHLIYDNLPFATLAAVDPSLQDRILTVNGVSKSHSMTGWRIGFGAGSKTLIKAMTMIQSHSTSNACSLSQAAAIEALSGSQDFLGEWVSIFQSRRNLAFDIINAIDGLSCLKPEGAFYLYINCEAVLNKVTLEGKVIGTDHDLALYLLDSVGVACVSGDAFGLSPYLRISYAVDTSILEKGCHRIRTAIQKLQS
jgi:aspartate aminotransferase